MYMSGQRTCPWQHHSEPPVGAAERMLMWEGTHRGEAAATGERGGDAALGSGWKRLMAGRVTA